MSAEILAEPQIGAIPLDPVGEQCPPMEGLLCPHREAVNQRDPYTLPRTTFMQLEMPDELTAILPQAIP